MAKTKRTRKSKSHPDAKAQRKLAEDTLTRSEEIFRSIFDNASIGIVMADATGTFIHANPMFQAIVGYSEPELLTMRFLELTLPSERNESLALFNELKQGARGHIQLERHYLTKAGTTVWCATHVSAFRDATGEFEHTIALVEDITKRKQAEEELRESEQKFRLLAENTAEAFWLLDPKGYQVLYVSPAYEKLWGRTCESLYEDPRSWLASVHPEDLERVTAALDKQAETGGFDEEFRLIRPDGSIRWIWDRGFPVKDESGQVHCVVRVAADITERKRADEALRESEERYRDYYEHAPNAYLSVDPASGLIIECNQTASDMLGRRKDEIIGHNAFEFYTQESHQRVRAAWQELLDQGVLRDVELQVQHKNGTLIDVSLDATAVLDQSGSVVRSRSIWHDITEKKRAEDALRESEERFRVSLMHSPVVVFQQDMMLRYTWIHNPVPGFSVEGILGKTDAELLPPEDAAHLTQLKRQVIASGVGTRREIQATVSGHIVYHDLTIEPLRDDTGAVVGITAASFDITERNRMEESLLQAREALEGKVERQLLRRNPYSLTFRELTVLHQVADGLADKEIAAQLGISPLTVHKHVGNILAKMNAASRTEAGVRAQREGLLTEPTYPQRLRSDRRTVSERRVSR